MKKKKNWLIIKIILLAIILIVVTHIFTTYHADEFAITALNSDDKVEINKTEYGWFFDGPSSDDVLIFYPGAKVEVTSYAPLLHKLADEGIDVCLVKMPIDLAIFGENKANDIINKYEYDNYYIGGHSLGGVIAANYASKHSEPLTGVILLGAYPIKELDDNLLLISIYGSNDGVINKERLIEGDKYAPNNYQKYEIKGGNHAQFGNYGKQKGDGSATITSDIQQELTIEFIIENK